MTSGIASGAALLYVQGRLGYARSINILLFFQGL
jgi:hypothetical protein